MIGAHDTQRATRHVGLTGGYLPLVRVPSRRRVPHPCHNCMVRRVVSAQQPAANRRLPAETVSRPCRARTDDQRIKSPTLYQLS